MTSSLPSLYASKFPKLTFSFSDRTLWASLLIKIKLNKILIKKSGALFVFVIQQMAVSGKTHLHILLYYFFLIQL